MAKIKLTRRTFSATIANAMTNDEGFTSLLTKALMGKTMKEFLNEQPDNLPLWVDTDKVGCVTGIIKDKITQDIVFGIMFQYQQNLSDIIWIDGKEYDAFMKAWKGE